MVNLVKPLNVMIKGLAAAPILLLDITGVDCVLCRHELALLAGDDGPEIVP